MSKSMAEALKSWMELSQEEKREWNRKWIEEFAHDEVTLGKDLPEWLR